MWKENRLNWLKPYVRSKKRFYKKFIDKNVDTDKDRVPNYRDCQPLNPHKHHLTKTIRKRVYQQPIYIASKTKKGSRIYPISQEIMPYQLHKQREKVLSIMSQRPDIIGEIERQKPKLVIYTRGLEKEEPALGFESDKTVVVRTTYPRRTGQAETIKIIKEAGYRTPESQLIGSSTIHELEHVRQRGAYHGKRYKKLFKGKYEYQKGEKLAREAETESIYRRYAYPEEEELEAGEGPADETEEQPIPDEGPETTETEDPSTDGTTSQDDKTSA